MNWAYREQEIVASCDRPEEIANDPTPEQSIAME